MSQAITNYKTTPAPSSIPDNNKNSWYLGGFRCVSIPKIYIVDDVTRNRTIAGLDTVRETPQIGAWKAMGFFASDSDCVSYQVRKELTDETFKDQEKAFYGDSVAMRNVQELSKELANKPDSQNATDITGTGVNRLDDKNGKRSDKEAKVKNLGGTGDTALGDSPNAKITEQDSIIQAVADTSLGGNDVINPYWSYNEDDDIVHPQTAWNRSMADNSAMNLEGLGRVYAENIDRYQQVLWVNMGIPQYKGSITSLFGGSSTQARLVNRGNTLGGTIGNVMGTIFSFVLMFPLLPLYGIMKLVDIFNVYPVTKYFEHRSAMPMYYKFVNILIGHMAVNLGLYRATEDTIKWLTGKVIDSKKTDNSGVTNGESLYHERLAGVPQILADGPDMMAIMYRKVKRMRQYNKHLRGLLPEDLFRSTSNVFQKYIEGTSEQREEAYKAQQATIQKLQQTRDAFRQAGKEDKVKETEAAIQAATQSLMTMEEANNRSALEKFGSWVKNMFSGSSDLFGMMAGTGLLCLDYIGFKVEKSTSVSESVSNTTGQLEIAGQINGAAQQGMAKQHSMLGNLLGGRTGIPGLDDIMQGIGGFFSGAADVLRLGNAVNVITGNGFVDIPEAWQSSSFSRSYSVELQLRARYGDPVSWLQAVGIPLACVLAAALPRGVGSSMYTSPFLVRCYCKGMFSIPTGIIESVSMTRGESEFGWTMNKLPLSINVNITIKDLSPILYVGMDNDMNTSLDEYMSTLTGLGLYERTTWFSKILRRFNRCILLFRNTTANPLYWGNLIGNTGIVKLGGLIASPFSRNQMNN